MIKTFTPNDVVRYLYKETSQTENREFEKAMICRSDLLDDYVQLETITTLMDKIQKSPSARVLQGIMDYSNSINPIFS